MSDYLDDYEHEPHEALYFRARIVLDKEARYGARGKEQQAQWMRLYQLTEADIEWFKQQEPVPTYYHGATWEQVRAAWDKIKVSYEAYQASKVPGGISQ